MALGNNLFRFAPRELSQSAFWAWVLNSLDPSHDEREDVRAVGEALLERVGAGVPRTSIEVETEHTWGDAGRVDIHVDIDGEAEVVVEHKVTAPLRPHKLFAYQESGDESVSFVLLSSSYDLWKRRTDDGYEGFEPWTLLDAEDLLDILPSTATSHPVVADYRAWLSDRVDEWKGLEEMALSEEPGERKEALKTVPGQWRFMERVTESFANDGRQYGTRGRASGSPYTQFRFVERGTGRDALIYRIEKLSGGPVFRLRQYDPRADWNDKKKRRDMLRECWNQCVEDAGALEWQRPSNRGKKNCNIASIDLRENSASELAEELKGVHSAFKEHLEREFNWQVGRHVYRYGDCRECGQEIEIERSISKHGGELFHPDRCRDCES